MITSAEIDAAVEGQTVPRLFLATVAAQGDQVALRWKDAHDAWHEATFAAYAEQVARVAAGLAALGLGRGDRLLLMLRNRPGVASLARRFLPRSLLPTVPLVT